MSVQLEQEIKLKIAQIISRSRCNEESFLTDTDTASKEIISLIKQFNLIGNE